MKDKLEDDYYLVSLAIRDEGFRNLTLVVSNYECDEIEGLLHCIFDKINEAKNKWNT